MILADYATGRADRNLEWGERYATDRPGGPVPCEEPTSGPQNDATGPPCDGYPAPAADRPVYPPRSRHVAGEFRRFGAGSDTRLEVGAPPLEKWLRRSAWGNSSELRPLSVVRAAAGDDPPRSGVGTTVRRAARPLLTPASNLRSAAHRTTPLQGPTGVGWGLTPPGRGWVFKSAVLVSESQALGRVPAISRRSIWRRRAW